jgi:hypothetical protein
LGAALLSQRGEILLTGLSASISVPAAPFASIAHQTARRRRRQPSRDILSDLGVIPVREFSA